MSQSEVYIVQNQSPTRLQCTYNVATVVPVNDTRTQCTTIVELENGKTQVVEHDEVYNRINGILAIHLHCQDAEIDSWGIVVPNDANTKEKII